MKSAILIGAALLISALAFAQTKAPVGEFADFELNKNRSHRIILSGQAESMITKYNPNAQGGPAYEFRLIYEFVVRLMGPQKSTETFEIPAEYLSPEFMQNLRSKGYYFLLKLCKVST